MRRLFQLTAVLAFCLAIMNSCNFPHHRSNSNPLNFSNRSEKPQSTASNRTLMNQITAEMFEPKMEKAVEKICRQDFLINKMGEKFFLECERHGSVTMQDKKDKTGKYGTCKYRVSFYKQKKRSDKYKGYVDIIITGLIEIRSDESYQFVPTEYQYSTINQSIWQWKKSEIQEGVVYILNWAPEIIKAIKPFGW